MTLCLAWKKDNQIHFASDSRISTSTGAYADVAIKIMEVPVTIISPIAEETGKADTIYNSKIGICYCGASLQAYLIKEAILVAMRHLQQSPYSNFSMQGICILICKYVEHISNQMLITGNINTSAEFMVGGYCPAHNHVKVYKIALQKNIANYQCIINEVLQNNDDIEMMGSGMTFASQILATKTHPTNGDIFNALKEVCNDVNILTVGGYLQYGTFDNSNNFNVYGVIDYKIENGVPEYLYTHQGVLLYRDTFEHANTNFHIGVKYISPFQKEIDALWQQNNID